MGNSNGSKMGCGIDDVVTCVEKKSYPRDPENTGRVLAGYVDCEGKDIDPCDEVSRCPQFTDGTKPPSVDGRPVIPRVRVASESGHPLFPDDSDHSRRPDQLIGLNRSDGVEAKYDPATGIFTQQGIVTPDGKTYPFNANGDQIIGITNGTYDEETGEWTVNVPAQAKHYCRMAVTDLIDTSSHTSGDVLWTPATTLTNPSSVFEMCVQVDATVQVGVYTPTGGRGFVQPYLNVDGVVTPVWGQQTDGPALAPTTGGETIAFEAQYTIPPGGSLTFALGATVVDNPSITAFYPTSLNIRANGHTTEG